MINFAEQDEKTKKNLIAGIKSLFPIKGRKNTLEITDLSIDTTNVASNLSKQKDIKLKGKTLSENMVGTFVLKDENGKVIDTQKMKIMDVPAITERSTYIIKGTEYNVPYQFRIRPGVYSRVQDDGNLTALVNLAKGSNFKVTLDDEDEKFYLLYKGSKIPLYPVLTSLGKTRSEIESVWGKELVDINSDVKEEQVLRKLHAKMGGEPGGDLSEVQLGIESVFNDTVIDETTTKKTLGKPFSKVDANLLLRTSKKLLNIKKGDEDPDERDSLRFKSVHGLDDFMNERIKAQEYKIKRSILNRVDIYDDIKKIVSPSNFNNPINSLFHDGSLALAATPKQANPVSLAGEATKITLTGAGGITNPETVTDEARSVHPSSIGLIDPMYTPESGRIGLTLHMPVAATREGDTLTTTVLNAKTMKEERIDASVIEEKNISFMDEFERDGKKIKPKNKKVRAYTSGGKIGYIDPKDVDYIIPDGTMLFSSTTNLIPFLQNTHSNRGMMGAKMISQALPLADPEAPLVQPVLMNQPIHKIYGEGYVTRAKDDGVVKKITDSEIVIRHGKKDESYPYYKNFPLNEGHFFDDKVVVKKGDTVKKGQLLAENMFTKDGILSYGKNLKVGYMAPKGLTFEDAVVVSESAAKRMASKHMYKKSVEVDDTTELGLKKFRLYAPTDLSSANASKLDEDGVIKVGETVEPGDIVFAGLRKMVKTPDEEIIGKFNKKVKPYRKYTKEWDNDFMGEVTDVVKSPKEITIYIKTEEVARPGDKLAGKYGNKGVISEVFPDHEMPANKEGEPLDIIMNPLGVPSRMNPSQLLETAAGKIAKKKGSPYYVRNFSGENYLDSVKKGLKEAGITDKEELFDQKTGKPLGNIMTGNQYIMKLDHNVAKKLSARGPLGESPYTDDLTPTAGKGTGGLREDALTVYSMLSHGATKNLKEMQSDKAEKNDEFWMALESGLPLPKQKPTFAWNKFISSLNAAGINVKEDGKRMQLLPMTDTQTEAYSNGEVKKEDMLRSKNLSPMKGGLFDKELTGGVGGNKWTHIDLAEPMLNPLYIKAVRAILDVTSNDIDNVISGRLYIDENGKKTTKDSDGAMTGSKALKRALSNVDVKSELENVKREINDASGNKLDKLNRKARYLKNLQSMGEKPDVFMVKKVPVLPPMFRPIYPLPDGNLRVSDINVPYKDLITINNQLKDMKYLPDEQLEKARTELFDSYKALVGTASPVTRKEFKGIVQNIAGDRPKTGFFQSKVISKRQELSGRSTVVPSPNLPMDEIEVPDDIIWTLYKPFIKKRLKAQGYTLLKAGEEIDNKTAAAQKALDLELESRPIMMNRAPSLHKFSVMSFFPKRSAKKAIGVNPFVVSGFNMDFDGDAVSLHVPVREESRKEAFKLMPSANLISPRDNSLVHKPSMEVIVGLNVLTREGKSTNKKYTSEKQALDAYKDGFISMNDMVNVSGKKTNVGRILLNSKLPEGFKVDFEITKKTMNEYLSKIAKDSPQNYSNAVGALRDVGYDHAYKSGFTIGLDDLSVDKKKKKMLLDKAEKALGKKYDDAKVIDEYGKVLKKMDSLVNELPDSNSLKLMMDSGSKGKASEIRQIVGAPVLVQDLNEKPVPLPIVNSYADGLTSGEFFATQAGTRRSMMDRALQTKWPGALNKELVNSTASQVITTLDCGTREGISMDVGDSNILDRYVASDSSGTLRYNQLIDSNARAKLISKKVKSIKVRSPLTCEAVKGICSKCFGINEFGEDVSVGDNVGVKAAQTISEPSTQMSTSWDTEVVYFRDGDVVIENIGELIDREIASSGEMRDDGWEVAKSDIDCISFYSDGKLRLSNVSLLSRHKAPSYMVKIKVMGGRSMTVTPSHSFVIRNNNKIVKAAAKDLCIGKRLPVLKKTPDVVNVTEIDMGEFIRKKYRKGTIDVNIGKIKLDKMFGWIIGMYLSDGSTSNGQVSISRRDLKCRKRIKSFFKRFGLLPSENVNSFGGIDLVFSSAMLKDFFCMMAGSGYSNKHLPEFSYASPLEFVYGVISGYMDGDSSVSVSRNNIRIFAKNEKVMDQLKYLMTRVGMYCNKNIDSKDMTVLTIGASYASEILDHGNVTSEASVSKLTQLSKKVSGKDINKDIVDGFDGIGNILLDISKSLGLPSRYVNSATKRGTVGRRTLEKHIKRFEEESEKKRIDISEDLSILKELVSSDVVWTPIVSIEYIEPAFEYVYDFTVPGPQTFATFDGIVTANTMRSFHTGGAIGDQQSISQGFWRIQDLFHLRSNLPGKATVARVNGTVGSIIPSSSGGFNVFINGEKHTVPAQRTVSVKVGDKVSAGDAISTGPIKPQEIAEYKTMEDAQKYIVDELDKTYRGNGIKVNRRMFETVVKPMTTVGRVTDPGDSDFIKGDFLDKNFIKDYNKSLKKKIEFEPYMTGVNTVPLYTEDWLARLNSTRLKDTLMEGASRGFVSELSPRYSPIATHAYGIEKTGSIFQDIYLEDSEDGDD